MKVEQIKKEIERLWTMYYDSMQFRDWTSCNLIIEDIDALEEKLKEVGNEI